MKGGRGLSGGAAALVCAGIVLCACERIAGLDDLPFGPGRTGAWCSVASDCMSGVCAGGHCQSPTCVDRVRNGDESGVDFGGHCCEPGDTRCVGGTPQSCSGAHEFQSGAPCSMEVESCAGGACVAPPSCLGLPSKCGPTGDDTCCRTKPVPGGTYNRSNDAGHPATVSDFRLDRYEITVGRFRAFAKRYPESKPGDGAGAHPLIPGSGWRSAWDGELPLDYTALTSAVKCSAAYQTWTDPNEDLPMNCITWYEAFAFCAWDGGRLPTEAEWNDAAAGGADQRLYPWGVAPPDPAHAAYDCTADGSPPQSCAFADILKVGSKPAGDGKFGQADLAGSVWEWTLDFDAPYANPCADCANLTDVSPRMLRGGSFSSNAASLGSSTRSGGAPADRRPDVGARCARNL